MSERNNVMIIPENIRRLYAESVKDNKSRSISDLDNLVTNKVKSVYFLRWCESNIRNEKILASEFLNFINSFWPARKERVTFTEISRILECLYSAAKQYDQKYDDDDPYSNMLIDILDKYKIANKAKIIDLREKSRTKFEDYFNLIDSIYDKYCSRVVEEKQNIEYAKIKLVYQVLYWAGLKANIKGFRLESLLNFIDKNLAACNEVNTKLPVLDRNDIWYIFEVLGEVLAQCQQGALTGSEVAKTFDLASVAYKVLCAEIERIITRVGRQQYNDGYGENCFEVALSLVMVLKQAIKKGNVEKIQTKAVFELAINVWKMLCETKVHRKAENPRVENFIRSVLDIIIYLLKKKNKSIDKANEKLKSIGFIYNGETSRELIDQKANNDFLYHMENYSNLISEICEIYFGRRLGEGIGNAAPSAVIEDYSEDNDDYFNRNNNNIDKDKENGDTDGRLNYYSDISDDKINTEVNPDNNDINKDKENGGIDDRSNYYSDINDDKINTEVNSNNNDINKDKESNNDINTNLNDCGNINVNQNNDPTVKSHEEESERISLIPAKNDGGLNSDNKNKTSANNNQHYEKKQSDIYNNDKGAEIKNIINNPVDPKTILAHNVSNNKDPDQIENNHKTQEQVASRSDMQEINLDDQFKKHKAIYWLNVFSIVFKLISFAFLIVTLLSLISLSPYLAPIFAPILESLAPKLIISCVAFGIALLTWKLSKTLKPKILCHNNDKNKKIGEEKLKEPYVIDKSRKIIPVLSQSGEMERRNKILCKRNDSKNQMALRIVKKPENYSNEDHI